MLQNLLGGGKLLRLRLGLSCTEATGDDIQLLATVMQPADTDNTAAQPPIQVTQTAALPAPACLPGPSWLLDLRVPCSA